jgi:hypothetical protein
MARDEIMELAKEAGYQLIFPEDEKEPIYYYCE